MRNQTVKAFALAVGALLVAVALSVPANADARFPNGTPQVLWTYYETTEPFSICLTPLNLFSNLSGPKASPARIFDPDGCNHGGRGDNIIRLINPNGGANSNLSGDRPQTVCAMVYVFDDDEEMGECCGCPLTSAQLATFSVEHNLTSNWGLTGGSEGGDHGNGAIAIIAAGVNPSLVAVGSHSNGHSCSITQSGACNAGCDPTNNPGYDVTTTNNLFGSITHNQITLGAISGPLEVTGITETELSNDAGGDAINLTYLQNQCGALVGNGSQGGICNCPIE